MMEKLKERDLWILSLKILELISPAIVRRLSQITYNEASGEQVEQSVKAVRGKVLAQFSK